MKVTNWRKKLAAAIVAAGIWVPSVAHAVSIPVGDASFQSYPVPAVNYAYAKDPAGAYRPSGSPWVSNMDSPDPGLPGPDGGQYFEDVQVSNYLYNTTYANTNNRGTPRSGDQAMHGFGQYSSQDLPGVIFEAGKTYTLTVWAQNDTSNTFSKGIWMYLYNANVAFSDANAVKNSLVLTAINTRTAGMSSIDSINNWSQLTVSHTVVPGAPEVGAPLGVGFFVRRGTAIDDVSLDVVPVPEPTSVLMVGLGGVSVFGLRRRR